MYSGSPWCDEVDSERGLTGALDAFFPFDLLVSGLGCGLVLPSSKNITFVKMICLRYFRNKLLTSFHCERDMSFRSGFVKHKCQSGQKLKRKNWRLKMVNHTSNMNLIYSPYLLLAIPLLNFWNEGLLSAKSMVFWVEFQFRCQTTLYKPTTWIVLILKFVSYPVLDAKYFGQI